MTFNPAMPSVPVSWGELLDKLSILAIKQRRIADPVARANVAREHDLLRRIAADALRRDGIAALMTTLGEINEALWEIEDAIRVQERRGSFGDEFVRLARAVYHRNDERAAIKRAISERLGSALVEEKSYASARAIPGAASAEPLLA